MSAAAIRKIYVLHTLVQGAIFTRSSSGDGIHTRGESQHQHHSPPSNIYMRQKYRRQTKTDKDSQTKTDKYTRGGNLKTNATAPHLIFTRASSNIQKTDKDRQKRQRQAKTDKDTWGAISHLIFTTASSNIQKKKKSPDVGSS